MIKSHKLLFIFNVIILLACLFGGYRYFNVASRHVGNNVVYVTQDPRRHAFEISLDSIKYAIMEFPDYNIAFEYRSSGNIVNGNRNKNTSISFVNHTYFLLNNHLFLHGGGWPESFNDSKVIVLSENVAWELLGTINAVSAHVEMGGSFFEVSGIIRQECLDEPGFVWTPYNHHGSRISNVTGIYIQGRNHNTMERLILAEQFLATAELNLANLRLIDLDQYACNILVKFNLLAMSIALGAGLFFSARLFYILEDEEINLRKSIVYVLSIILSISLCVFLWQSIDVNLPPTVQAFSFEALIDNLSNSDTFEGVGNLSHSHQELYELNRSSNFPLALGVLAFANIFVIGLADTFIKYKQYIEQRRMLV